MSGSCREAEAAWQRQLDGTSEPGDLQHLEQHIQSCARCAELLEGWSLVERLDAAAPVGRPDDRLPQQVLARLQPRTQRRRSRIWQVATAAGAVAAAAAILLLWRLPEPPPEEFQTRGNGGSATGLRVFCVAGSESTPLIRELLPGAPSPRCQAGEFLQFAASVSEGNPSRCLFIVGETASGEQRFSLPPPGIPACLALPPGPAAVVNEPLPGGVRLHQDWGGEVLVVRVLFGEGPFNRGQPGSSAIAEHRRTLRVEMPEQ